MNGRRLGHYEIVRRLGSGGMGVVWEARDTRLDRLVAVKTLPAEATGDVQARARLLQEARAAAALDHRNVCTVHDVGETEEGGLYVVMALYRGRSLKERMAAGPVPVEEALDLAAQAAEGLAAMHSRGILHRDVKPANLFVTETGDLKVLDFGLALAATSARLTATGTVIGTLAYMPPEQLRGEEIGPAADLWALGVTLFEMLAGELPFPTGNHGQLLNAILNHPPVSLSRMRSGLPDGVADLVERCLERDPGARVSSAAGVEASLKRILGRPASGPRAREGTGDAEKTVAFSGAAAPRDSDATSSAPAASGEAPKLKLYEHCARGRQLVQEMGLGGFERAREELAKALAIDPDHPSAHAILGMLHLMRHIAGPTRPTSRTASPTSTWRSRTTPRSATPGSGRATASRGSRVSRSQGPPVAGRSSSSRRTRWLGTSSPSPCGRSASWLSTRRAGRRPSCFSPARRSWRRASSPRTPWRPTCTCGSVAGRRRARRLREPWRSRRAASSSSRVSSADTRRSAGPSCEAAGSTRRKPRS
ncbi:MAG: protein kinase [Holophagales bacterium]|nr:protein kinase [Holophagales bacterium]